MATKGSDKTSVQILDATLAHINNATNDVLMIIAGHDCGERLTREDVVRLAKSVDVALQEAQKEHDKLKRFADSLLSVIADVSNALGISEEEQETANGSAELLFAIEELKLSANAEGVCERIEEYGGLREKEGGSDAVFQKFEARRHRAEADEVLGEIRAMLAASKAGDGKGGA